MAEEQGALVELVASSGVTVTSARTVLLHPVHLQTVSFATASPGLEQSVPETLSPPSEGKGHGLSLESVAAAEGKQARAGEECAGAETRRSCCLHPDPLAPQQQHSDRPCGCSCRAYF